MSALITILDAPEAAHGSEALEAGLRELGMETRTVRSFEEAGEPSDLVLVLHAEKQGGAFNAYALQHGITWLPVQFSHMAGRIGPIMIPHETACYKCMELRAISNSMPPMEHKESCFGLSWSLIGLMAAVETVKWVSRHTNSFVPVSLGHVFEFDAFHLQGEISPVYKVPTCPACGIRQVPHLAAQPWNEAGLVHER